MRTTIRRMTGVALLWLGGCTQVWAVPALQEVKVNPLLAVNSCWSSASANRSAVLRTG